MRQHAKEFKNEIQKNGRQLDSKIIIKGSELVLGAEDLLSVTPVTNSTLLKSVMKEVDFESKKQIGIGQEVNIKSGVKVNGEYEYIDYGNYSVYKSEYKAETDTYSHICYDKMLKTMIDYTPLDITYPINLREYINAIATKCGLEFADKNSTFANYNTSINEDHFSNGNYTFRDVLDYIAQLVGGWLCINDNDELEIRYPELARNYDKVSGENVNFISNVEDEINTIIVDGKSTQETSTDPVSPSPDYPSEVECVRGKNLFDKSKIFSGWIRYSDNVIMVDSSNTYYYTDYIEVSSNTTYTLNLAKQTGLSSGGIMEYDSSKNWLNIGLAETKQTITFTTSVNTKYIRFTIRFDSKDKVMLEKGSVATDYVPYDTIQVKDTKVNIFNSENWYETFHNINPNDMLKTTINEIEYYKFRPNTIWNIPYMKGQFKENTQYIFSAKARQFDNIQNYSTGIVFVYTDGTTTNLLINKTLEEYTYYLTSAPNKTIDYIRLMYAVNNYVLMREIQLQEGTIPTEYEPYQENIININLQGNELCSLPNNVKDELVIENGRAKIIKRVGKVVLDGSENWGTIDNKNTGDTFYSATNVIDNLRKGTALNLYCDKFKNISNLWYNNNVVGTQMFNLGNALRFRILKTELNEVTINGWKSWLSTHNTIVYYVLATPIEIDLGEVETLSTFEGVNNVSLDANMQTNMSLTYTTEFEELDKHFLKDVNVSFYKKYGAVNSVVFSRGNGSDNIYRKDNMSISRNGLTEIKITGNPFLEGNDRENFIQQLFDKINGLEFYIMDVSSTGIMYLELGDFYYFNMVEEKPSLKSGLVKSGMRQAQGSSGGKFLCLLMNDEIKITQGLEESIYSDEPEITETDYKTASITDTSIKNAIIQTNKNSAEILLKVNSDEVVSAINLSPEKIKISSSKLDIDAIATFTNSKLAEAGSTVINGANITTGSINCDRLNGGTINGQKISGSTISGGSISITKGVYYFNMGTATSNPNCSGLNVGGYGIKAYSDITATGFAITDSDTGKSYSIGIYDGHGKVHYLTFTGGIITKWEYK